MLTISKKHTFEMAHRLMGHQGKCGTVHGHGYKVEMAFTGPSNYLGMVMDYGDIKRIVCSWIDDNWDHQLMFHSNDPIGIAIAHAIQETKTKDPDIVCENVVFVPFNPTAENMARYLVDDIIPQLLAESDSPDDVYCAWVQIEETATSTAFCAPSSMFA